MPRDKIVQSLNCGKKMLDISNLNISQNMGQEKWIVQKMQLIWTHDSWDP